MSGWARLRLPHRVAFGDGARRVSVGPALGDVDGGVPGCSSAFLLQQYCSFAGDPQRSSVNQLTLQPFVTKLLPDWWYVQTQPIITLDFAKRTSSVPLNLVVASCSRAGGNVNVQATAYPLDGRHHRPRTTSSGSASATTFRRCSPSRSRRRPTGRRAPSPVTWLDMCSTCCYVSDMPRMIQLRHVPDDLHRKLKARAALEGLSLSDYLLQEVRRVAERPTLAELRRRLAQRTAESSRAFLRPGP